MLKSLRVRLSIVLILTASAVLAIFGFYGHRQLANALDADFAEMQDATAVRIVQSVSIPLWEVNRDAIRTILRAQLASADVVGLLVKASDGTTMAASTRDAKGAIVDVEELPGQGGLRMERPIYYEERSPEPIGQLVIIFTRAELD